MPNTSECLYRAAQIREAERIAIEELHITGDELMRRAGSAAFALLQKQWPETKRISVFCGSGNNGGDGYVVAKLAWQAGYQLRVFAIEDTALLKGEALAACQEFLQAGGEVNVFSPDCFIPPDGIIVDALLGIGINRQVMGNYALAINAINASDNPVLAMDICSGLHADTGCAMGNAVQADFTISFIGLKCGLFTADAANYCGEIICADLALPEAIFAAIQPLARLQTKTALPVKSRTAHKGHFGHVLCVGGNFGYSGAIRMAAEAALRTGAGLVSIASRASHADMLNIGRPELMCHAVEDVRELQKLLAGADVVVIGPGLGQDDWAQALFNAVIACELPKVVDADALNLLAKTPVQRNDWILTPHPGEASRLLDCSTSAIGEDRYLAIQSLQNTYGGVCVLKGSGSLLSDGRQLFVATTGNPGMSSGGMGDVLSGIIAGLRAIGLSSLAAANLGVYVHGEAADRQASKHGEYGMLASDLFAEMRACLNQR